MNSQAMLLETYPAADLTQREVVPCRTESGTAEFFAEVKRVCRLRDEALAAGEEWEAVDISLTFGDVIHDTRRVTKDSPSALVLTTAGAFA